MNKTNLLTLAITLTVGIILVGSILMPIVNDAQTQISTEQLNSTERYIMAGSNDDVVMVATADGWEINGEIVTLPTPYFAVAFGEKGVIRFGSTTASVHTESARIGNIVKFEYSEGTLTMTKNNDTTQTEEWSYLFYPSNKGDYGMFERLPGLSESLNVDKNQTAYYIANTAWNNSIEFWGVWEVVNGDVTDTLIPFCYATTYNGTINVDSDAVVEINYTPSEDGLSNVYQYGSVTSNGTTYANQSFIVAPLTYHIHSQADNAALQLIGVLPILIIVSLILAATGTIFVRRND